MEAVRASLAKLDKSGTGLIECSALVKILQALDDKAFDQSFVDRILCNGQGAVKFAGFCSWLNGETTDKDFMHQEAEAEEGAGDDHELELESSAVDQMLARAKAKFQELDNNGNGELDPKELPNLCEWVFSEFGRKFKTLEAKKEAIEKQVKRFEKMAEGGKWNFERFESYYESVVADGERFQLKRAEAFAKGYDKSAGAARFRELDVNNSGFLDGEEIIVFASWVFRSFRPDGNDLTEAQQKAEGQKLLQRLDDKKGNNDGKLSFAEVDMFISEKVMQIEEFKKKRAERDAKKAEKAQVKQAAATTWGSWQEGDIVAAVESGSACPGPVDCSSLCVVAKDYNGLLPQPAEPKFKGALCQIYVRSQPYGGSDKSSNGHRYDSIPFANGMINAGMSCQLIHYVHEEHDKFFEVCKNFDFIIVRCNPGQIKSDGGDQGKFDSGMRVIREAGIQVWPSPDVMEKMGAKDALCKVATLNIGLEDTLAYYSEEDFGAGFSKTMAFQPRVIKQNRGSSGEGIWIIKLKAGNYCAAYGERSCKGDEVLTLMEANDNHEEEHTVAEFIEFCVNGRTDKSGTWTSKGVGKYLEGGKDAGGQIVDQRFCPRIVEGELRYNQIGDAVVGIIHKKPKEGGISAVGGTGSIYTYYGADEPKFATLTDNFLKHDLPKIMPALDLADEPVPLWWTTDFILASPEGTPSEEEKWIVGEFNCSCVGISKCLAAYCKDDTPNATYDDISAEDKEEANKYGEIMGTKALGIMEAQAKLAK
ncbi:unnamed protein product [Polarella glacialis]|uniref:EF-hand domain-containing protein n=1 Tax=Polarella glacialis TaxID=89957 RepID=A0A813HZD3_POLGL|nr:unnamed protein product [Polarella glacialis]